jgi:hypothetical protein
VPRTKAASAAECERSPRSPRPKWSRAGAARRAATKRFKHHHPYPSKPSPSRAQARPDGRTPQRASHRACAMAASQLCSPSPLAWFPIALARWLHPNCAPLHPSRGFPSRLRDGCIPPRLHLYSLVAGCNAPGSVPRTKAASAAECERSPRSPRPKWSRTGAARRAATKRFKHHHPYPSKTSPSRAQARPDGRTPQRASHRACAMAASQLCSPSPLAWFPIALARWLHPNCAPLHPSRGFPSRLRDGCIPTVLTFTPRVVSHRACAMAASQLCSPSPLAWLPIALARWLHPAASALVFSGGRLQCAWFCAANEGGVSRRM